ncbi:uncharacterized protein LOC143036642 [Oratosquilla oratoria]|uniref:uncharacterized protein LOC143036642 n=1 Tax=Oratosquilla oratoria TaxID=337810 RepID=UPI003F76AAF7
MAHIDEHDPVVCRPSQESNSEDEPSICRCASVTTAAKVIAWLSLTSQLVVLLVLYPYLLYTHFHGLTVTTTWLVLIPTVGVVNMIVNGILLYGVYKVKHWCLLPYLIIHSMGLVCGALHLVSLVVQASMWGLTNTLVVTMPVTVIAIAIASYFFYVVFRCFSYYRKKAQAKAEFDAAWPNPALPSYNGPYYYYPPNGGLTKEHLTGDKCQHI